MGTAVCVYAPVVAALAFTYIDISRGRPSSSSHRPSRRSSSLASIRRRPGSTRSSSSSDADLEPRTRHSEMRTSRSRPRSFRRLRRVTATRQVTQGRWPPTPATSPTKIGLSPEEQERATYPDSYMTSERSASRHSPEQGRAASRLKNCREMEKHSEIGESILSKVEAYEDVAQSSATTTSGWTARVTRTKFQGRDPLHLEDHRRG